MSEISIFNYPKIKKNDVVDNYHGIEVFDPYRNLENLNFKDVQDWIKKQNKLTSSYIDSIPSKIKIKNKLLKIWNYPKYWLPHKEGNRYFFLKNNGLENHPSLYMKEHLNSEAILVLDTNKFSQDGSSSLGNFSFSKDSSLLAYGISKDGSDWQDIKIRNLDFDEDYADTIMWTKFSTVAWKHDNSGFFYNRFPDPIMLTNENENISQVYFHKVGTSQLDDILVYKRLDRRDLSFYPSISNDGKYIILSAYKGISRENYIFYREVDSDEMFRELISKGDASYKFIDNISSTFYFETDLNAPNGRIIAIDINNPREENWQDIISEHHRDVISNVLMVNDMFVVVYMRDAYHKIKNYDIEGIFINEIKLPSFGSVQGISGKIEDKELFISFTSYTYPLTIFRYNFDTDNLEYFHKPEIMFKESEYETKQVFCKSKDGTKIPIFITHKKGIKLDGNNPTILYGYGGFKISITPTFSSSNVLWLELGGIYAEAILRGGGEYGEEWHQEGMLQNKQNVFDDFISSANWLINNKYTKTSKLAIRGGSNGGLLVSTCMLQNPSLFSAVICKVPVTDMLRYHKFGIGNYWISEYGNAEENIETFNYLYKYSPLHNIKKDVCYPATFVLTGDTDDRVLPSHSFKFVATLQENDIGFNPILLRVDTKAGHGKGKATIKIIEEETDIFAFLLKQFNIRY